MSMNRILVEHILDSGQRLQIVQGDLTQERVDAIVNAANEFLQHGGGVAAAIARRGGAQIHAVGPVWGEGDEEIKLAAAVAGSLSLADRLKLTSIAFPAISTGIFGFPKVVADEVILTSIEDYCVKNPDSGLMEIRLTLFDQPTIEAFLRVWKSLKGEKGLITSVHNPKIQWVRALQSRSKARLDEQVFVVEGVRLCEEALQAGWKAQIVFYTEDLNARGQAVVDSYHSRAALIEIVSPHVFHAISDTETPQGILAVIERRTLALPEVFDFVFIPDGVRDPGNLGTIRSE